jgi:CheY-like chemotaxis protein
VTDRPGRSPRLLIADSYAAARVPCARYLALFNFHVDEAEDGVDALARLEAEPPDLLLIEQDLPAIDPFQLKQRLRRDEGRQSIPMIVLSSFLSSRSQDGLKDRDGVLVKPFPLASMIEEVRRVIRSRDNLPPVPDARLRTE